MKRLKLGELFCGCGGIGLGFKLACEETEGIKGIHAFATDYSSSAAETYCLNLKPKYSLVEDIRRIDFRELHKQAGNIDILTFGFPCNDFSVIGEQKGVKGEFGALYTYCAKALKEFNPPYFIAENVGGLVSANENSAFLLILKAFEKRGYRVSWHLYDFSEYGVPQKRKRVIIVGIREDIKGVEFKVPAKIRGEDITAETALAGIPANAPNHEKPRVSKLVQERLSFIKEGQNIFNAEMPDRYRFKMKSNASISNLYRRLKRDSPSYTVIAQGGGGTAMYHWKENRPLTNRERARLQSFPDSFIFKGKAGEIRSQIGMAVPPAGIKHIFLALFRAIIKGHSQA